MTPGRGTPYAPPAHDPARALSSQCVRVWDFGRSDLMAGRGPAPKPSDERRRRNEAPAPTLIVADGAVHGPELPETHDWPAATVTWWSTWRTSAQAKTFTDTDWSFLLDTAVLHAEFWLGDKSVAAELRLRAAKFGATPEDRARLKIEIGQAGPASESRARPKGRRERLLRAVGDDDGSIEVD